MPTHEKGQSSSLYTLLGVLIVSVFALFLFVTQAGNQAENLRTLSSADVSYNTQLELRTLYEKTIPTPSDVEVKMIDLIKNGCKYGDESEGFKFIISREESIIVKPEERIEKHMEKNIGENFRMTVDCNNSGREMIMGKKVPANVERVIASNVEVPLPNGNKTKILLRRW